MPGLNTTSVPLGVWLAAYAALLAAACWTDVTRRRIPNALTFAGMAMGFTLASLPSGIGLGSAALGFAAGLLIPLVLNRFGVLGAGDVKLLAAIGAFVGPGDVLVVMLMTAVAGGLLALAVAVGAGELRAVMRNVGTGLTQWVGTALLFRRMPDAQVFPVSGQRMPYALAIAAGALFQLFYTGPMS